jgi:hypothetical protein
LLLYAHDNNVLGVLRGHNAVAKKEILDGGTLVALELKDLAVLVLLGGSGRVLLIVRVDRVDDVAVASKVLLHGLEELASVKLVRDTLDGGDGLAAIALLKTWVC